MNKKEKVPRKGIQSLHNPKVCSRCGALDGVLLVLWLLRQAKCVLDVPPVVCSSCCVVAAASKVCSLVTFGSAMLILQVPQEQRVFLVHDALGQVLSFWGCHTGQGPPTELYLLYVCHVAW